MEEEEGQRCLGLGQRGGRDQRLGEEPQARDFLDFQTLISFDRRQSTSITERPERSSKERAKYFDLFSLMRKQRILKHRKLLAVVKKREKIDT